MNSPRHFLDRSLPSQGRRAFVSTFALARTSEMSGGNAWVVGGETIGGQDPGEGSA